MPDVLTVIGAAILANVLLLGAIGWFLLRRHPDAPDPAERRPKADPRVVASAAGTTPTTLPNPASETDRLPRLSRRERLRDLIDGSVGMYLVRRMLGRPAPRASKEPFPPAAYLDEAVVASRIGAAPGASLPAESIGPVVSRPTRLVVAGSAAATPVVAAAAPPPPVAMPEPPATRSRLVRDTFVLVGAFAVVMLFAAALLPPFLNQPSGGVADATGTPDSSAPIVISVTPSPTQVAVAESPTPSPAPTLTPGPTLSPVPTQTPTLAPTATETPRVTRPPGATPTPTPVVTPKPSATPKPTATPTPTPTPPTPVAFFTWDPPNGLKVAFDGSGSVNQSTYFWDFGDGGSSTASRPTHTFPDTGQYTVTLTVYGPTGVASDPLDQFVNVVAP
jgi:hypothetical protein